MFMLRLTRRLTDIPSDITVIVNQVIRQFFAKTLNTRTILFAIDKPVLSIMGSCTRDKTLKKTMQRFLQI